MNRFLTVAAAAAAMLALTPAAGFAQTASYYTATPVAAPSQDSLITRTTVWHCGGGVCTAGVSNSRDAIMCQLFAQEVGKLATFSAAGKEFDADALAKCNAKAK